MYAIIRCTCGATTKVTEFHEKENCVCGGKVYIKPVTNKEYGWIENIIPYASDSVVGEYQYPRIIEWSWEDGDPTIYSIDQLEIEESLEYA